MSEDSTLLTTLPASCVASEQDCHVASHAGQTPHEARLCRSQRGHHPWLPLGLCTGREIFLSLSLNSLICETETRMPYSRDNWENKIVQVWQSGHFPVLTAKPHPDLSFEARDPEQDSEGTPPAHPWSTSPSHVPGLLPFSLSD